MAATFALGSLAALAPPTAHGCVYVWPGLPGPRHEVRIHIMDDGSGPYGAQVTTDQGAVAVYHRCIAAVE